MTDFEEIEERAGRSLWYDREGNPTDFDTWVRQFDGTRTVADDEFSFGSRQIFVTTVWVGLDYGMGTSSRPLIYETAVTGGPMDGYQARHASEAAALQEHHAIAALHRKGLLRVRQWFYRLARGTSYAVDGILTANRRPLTVKSGWLNTGLWSFALLCVLFAIVGNIVAQNWDWLGWNIAIAVFDGWMFSIALRGLLWRRARRGKTSPGRGSTRE